MTDLVTESPSLAQVQAKLRVDATRPGGAMCPCCRQHVQIYRRKINAGMAWSLIAMYRIAMASGEPLREWIHVPTQIGARSREEGKLAYWDLVEEESTSRPDGGRAGYWRITVKGMRFIRGLAVPKYARVYNGRLLAYDGDETVTIFDALGTKFDYYELMAGL